MSRTRLLLNKLSQVLLNFHKLKMLFKELSKVKEVFAYFNSSASSLYTSVSSCRFHTRPPVLLKPFHQQRFVSQRTELTIPCLHTTLSRPNLLKSKFKSLKTFNQCKKKGRQHCHTSGNGLLRYVSTYSVILLWFASELFTHQYAKSFNRVIPDSSFLIYRDEKQQKAQITTKTCLQRHRGRVVRAPDLKSGDRKFKPHSDHLTGVVSRQTLVQLLGHAYKCIANQSASRLLCPVDIIVSFKLSRIPVNWLSAMTAPNNKISKSN